MIKSILKLIGLFLIALMIIPLFICATLIMGIVKSVIEVMIIAKDVTIYCYQNGKDNT